MKKVILALSALVFGAVAFAEEGFSIGGYLRGGVSANVNAEKDAAGDDVSTYSTDTWLAGDYFGGKTRLRLNLGYEGKNGGITFRYQNNGLSDLFVDKDIKWGMGYVNFLDGKVIAEAGLLQDRFTSTGGWEDFAFDNNYNGGVKGVRLVVAPVEGLYLTAQASTLFTEEISKDEKATISVKDGQITIEGDDVKNGTISVKKGKVTITKSKSVNKFDEKVFAFTAKYGNEQFFVTGGAALAKEFYGSIGFTGVKDLNVVTEVLYDSTDATKEENNDAAVTQVVFLAEYEGVENLKLALLSYVDIYKDKNDDTVTDIKITPAVSYDFTDVITASLESTIKIPGADDADPYATIVPAVTFKASKKANAHVYGSISTDTDQAKHSAGVGVLYKF